jgi:hypothetical protein
MAVTDDQFSPDEDYDQELGDFDSILNRLGECGVPLQYIAQHVASYRYRVGDSMFTREEHPFLNILWVRHLASHYQNTLLGTLLTRIQPGNGGAEAVDLSLRPGSYRLM